MAADESQAEAGASVSGVLFSRSVRSTFASLFLATGEDDDDNGRPVIARIQFFENVTQLRSACRRLFRLGDRIRISSGSWHREEEDKTSDRNHSRYVVDVKCEQDLSNIVEILHPQFWAMPKCQDWQQRMFPPKPREPKKKRIASENDCSHSSNVTKREQGEYLANFLLSAVMHKIARQDEDHTDLDCPSTWATAPHASNPSRKILREKAIELLNSGSGVIDAAGGSGHVSMALAMMGVKSTVVDSRPSVGKLPGRDRKSYHRALAKSKNLTRGTELYCQPVVPFQSFRAWFGPKPENVDTSFRLPDDQQQEIPVCDESQELWKNCSAVVALHPDEATGAIVDMAVQRQVPFVICPCCVFGRLFPKRLKADGSRNVVSTYEDLLGYLQSKDKTIQRTELPFQGKNTALWSVF